MTFTQALIETPKMRRCQPVGNVHSGGQKTIFQCCLCGASHSCATSYRYAKHVQEFQAYHNAEKCQPLPLPTPVYTDGKIR